MPAFVMFNHELLERSIIEVLYQYLPLFLYGGQPTLAIRDYILVNQLTDIEMISLITCDLRIKRNKRQVSAFIYRRLSLPTVLKFNQILQRHRVDPRVHTQVAMAIITGFMAYLRVKHSSRFMDPYASDFMCATAELIFIEETSKASGTNPIKIKYEDVPLQTRDEPLPMADIPIFDPSPRRALD